ncbi:MAG TPA: RluA family pseudouridine synthase [Candidatus Mcinerneyibacteriales bacterium]|jgi:23S rRNA pseudouridine1911/1915/1917 synthase|nr:RluA family pseudouridine synthase [Candidatus Mcinerneyibacteriales bacterium]HPE19863.1 RluA family pseudouridine synthase [Candidatus Mcinerneyibacteriales bacterium]HPJ70829.1 RluA family pseudouridine synthase [Candidatus Mcinerneyibacteriales bacterium]
MDKVELKAGIEEPMRVDVYLAEELEWASRSTVQKWIREGCVRLRGKLCTKPGKKVFPGEELSLTIPPSEPSEVIPEEIPLDIVYEDDYLAVVNKRPGLVVHPGAGNPSGTLANGLLYYFQNLSTVDTLRPGIVHRLDKDTSGLLITAKDNHTHWKLAEMIAEKKITRLYWGIVIGRFEEVRGRIETELGRDPGNRVKMAVVSKGKHAVTSWETLEEYSGFSLVRFRLFTGRTHQIRVHASFMRHPILGDRLYGGMSGVEPFQKVDRQMLHARELGFIHPVTGKEISLTAPLFPDMEDVLKKLRATV